MEGGARGASACPLLCANSPEAFPKPRAADPTAITSEEGAGAESRHRVIRTGGGHLPRGGKRGHRL